jgi:glycosyltransferase involved in cell wall biosynthesis
MEIVHFGLIRPKKGLEKVIELAMLINRNQSPLHVRIVGDIADKWQQYFRQLKASTDALPITWDIRLPPARVADVLAGAAVAYLPFPDGASERRTSLIAVLNAEVPTITTHGACTPIAMARSVKFAADPIEAFDIAQSLVADPTVGERLRSEGRRYAGRFNWDRIASLHREVYDDVAQRSSRRSHRHPVPH